MSVLSSRRVVITGMGVISPLGNTPDELWQSLAGHQSGVRPSPRVTGYGIPTTVAAEAWHFSGEIDNFGLLESDQKKAIRKGLKVMCRECQMGVAAAQRTLHHARLTPGSFDPERAGVSFGSDYMLSEPVEMAAGIDACLDDQRQFHFSRWGDTGLSKMTPLWLLKYLPNMPASHIAIYNDMRGPNNSLTQREASANLAVGEAFRIIQRGHADIMLAGATGTRIHPMKAVHTALNEPLAEVSRPFDLNRTGAVLGEGAGAVVLEELNSAQQRGATIHGEVVAAASSSVADARRVAHRDVALANVLRAVLREAGVQPQQVGHIHAHGLATPSSDADEARALHNVLAEQAAKIPVVAAKSYFGNLGAGAGLVELVASLLAQAHDRLFPTINYETPDPACRLAVVRNDDTPPGDLAINLSVTPVGQASALVVRRFAG